MIPEVVSDAVVLHRSLLDHTVLCDICTRGHQCPYLARLRTLALAAAEREAQLAAAAAIVEETAGPPEGHR